MTDRPRLRAFAEGYAAAWRSMDPARVAAGRAMAVAILLAACSTGSVEPTPSKSGTPSAAPVTSHPESAIASPASPSTAPGANALRVTWSEVPFDGRIADVLGDGNRFVAVGAGPAGASAWTSSDGGAWETHEVPEQSFGELPDGSPWAAAMGPIVRRDETLYSFGATANFNDASHGAGWRWSDGLTWEAIASSSEFFFGEVIAVTASDDALVASTVTFGGPRGTPGVWRWTPTTSWVRTSLTDAFVGALAWEDGTFLAAEAGVGDGDQPALWTATEGSEWVKVDAPDGASSICALTTSAVGFLAWGIVGNRVAAWTWRDGADWVQSEVDSADLIGSNSASSAVACRVVAADAGLIAAVQVGDTTLVWTSPDGVRWQFQGSLQLSATTFGAFGNRVALGAAGRHVVLAGVRPDPAAPGGSRHVLLVGVLEP